MAYMESFATYAGARTLPHSEARMLSQPWSAGAVRGDTLSVLEWQAVKLGARDPLSSLHAPSLIARIGAALFGAKFASRLADPRLEALRRIAALSWRRGYSIHPDEVRAFVAAGFSTEQYELVVDHLSAARAARSIRSTAR